jgi:hypothetical protein
MAKTFYTERDIEDLHQRGVMVLDVDDSVVITDLGREKALALGIRLARRGSSSSASPAAQTSSQAELVAKIKTAVIARLGNDIDANLVETVIQRVLAQIK